MNRINDLIAEHVMGWQNLEINYVGTPEATPLQIELEDWIDRNKIDSVGLYWIDVEKDYWISQSGYNAWDPTHKIGQAVGLFSKFPNKDYLIEIIRRNDDLWSVKIANRKERYAMWYANESICMAICKATLATKGIEYER